MKLSDLSTEESKLLQDVIYYLHKNHKLFGHLVNAMQGALAMKLEDMHTQCSASEGALLNICFDKPTRAKVRNNELVLDYLKKFPLYFKWDWLFEDGK